MVLLVIMDTRQNRTDRFWSSYLVLSFILLIAILGLFFPQSNNTFTPPPPPPPPLRYALVLNDNTTQTLNMANQWKNITYNTLSITSPAFLYSSTPLPPQNGITCLIPGYYRVYLSVQTDSPPTFQNTTFHCRACHLSYAIRGIQQRNGQIYDISGSFTTINRAVSFLSKEFIILVNNGDVLQFQFKSLCPQLTLSPRPTTSTLHIVSL